MKLVSKILSHKSLRLTIAILCVLLGTIGILVSNPQLWPDSFNLSTVKKAVSADPVMIEVYRDDLTQFAYNPPLRDNIVNFFCWSMEKEVVDPKVGCEGDITLTPGINFSVNSFFGPYGTRQGMKEVGGIVGLGGSNAVSLLACAVENINQKTGRVIATAGYHGDFLMDLPEGCDKYDIWVGTDGKNQMDYTMENRTDADIVIHISINTSQAVFSTPK